jgi:hypothetical protein
MKAARESDLVKACLQLLRLRGVVAWRTNSGAAVYSATATARGRFVRFAGARGLSDIIGLLPPHGRLLALEVKRPGRKPTADQAGFLDAVRAAGGLALVVDDVRQLAEALDGEGRQP